MVADHTPHTTHICERQLQATFANVLALLGEARDDSGVHHLQHNLIIAGSVGEETGRLGLPSFRRNPRPDETPSSDDEVCQVGDATAC